MAETDFHVQGPTTIKIDGNVIGYTDNEDLIRITMTDHIRSFTRLDQGDMIAESVLSGTTAAIEFTMVAWDDVELWTMISKARGGALATVTAEGVSGVVGSTMSTRTFALTITPSRDDQTIYAFGAVLLTSGPEYIDFGNTVKRIALAFTSTAGDAAVTTTAGAEP